MGNVVVMVKDKYIYIWVWVTHNVYMQNPAMIRQCSGRSYVIPTVTLRNCMAGHVPKHRFLSTNIHLKAIFESHKLQHWVVKSIISIFLIDFFYL